MALTLHSMSVPKKYKIIVIGDSNVGKTCLAYRFTEKKILIDSEATIGVDFKERTVEIDDVEIKLWDTAGQERFRRILTAHFYRDVDAVVLVYDISNRNSFNALKDWINECQVHQLENTPMVLIGNKCDSNRVVTNYEAQQFSDQYKIPLFETSAKLEGEDIVIDSIFLTLAHKLKHRQPVKLSSVEETASKGSNIHSTSCC